MRAVAVIPSRWGSTRFPGKSLTPILGVPLVVRVARAVSRATCFSKTIVATDDARIRDVVEAAGFACVMTRPDHPSGTDRIAEAVAGDACEVAVNVQGDEPLVDVDLLARMIEALETRPDWDMTTAAVTVNSEIEIDRAHVVKVVCARDGTALYFSRSRIPFVREPGQAQVTYRRHLGLYAYRREFLLRFVSEPPSPLECAERLEQLRALEMGGRIGVLEAAHLACGVDTPEDVGYVEAILRQKGIE